MTGRLIVVEGLDGTGKTTFSKRLALALGAHWTTTPDPELREVRDRVDARWSDDERPLFYAGSVIEAGRRALETLSTGRDVVVDRYWLTTLVYARAAGCAADLDALEALVAPADATILLVVREDERRRRLAGRGMTALDAASLDRATQLGHLYERTIDRPVSGRVFVLEASAAEVGVLVGSAIRRLRLVSAQDRGAEQLLLFGIVHRRAGGQDFTELMAAGRRLPGRPADA